MEGYTYHDERSFDVAERIAANEAIGQMSNLGIGLGMMGGIGGAVGGVMSQALSNAAQPQMPVASSNAAQGVICPKCQTPLPANARFCFGCGSKVEAPDGNEVICPKCGQRTPKGKFCAQCGQPLSAACSNCGSELPDGAKFCLNCGQKQ